MLEMLHEESATSTRASVERRFYTVFLVFSIIFYSIAGIIAFFFDVHDPVDFGKQ